MVHRAAELKDLAQTVPVALRPSENFREAVRLLDLNHIVPTELRPVRQVFQPVRSSTQARSAALTLDRQPGFYPVLRATFVISYVLVAHVRQFPGGLL